MGGKAALLLVLSFSIIFLILGHRFGWLSTESVRNLSSYYIETKAHNIAVSGANLAANAIFVDHSWNVGYDDLEYNGGEIDVDVQTVGSDIVEVIAEGTYAGVTKAVKIRFRPSSFAKFAYYMNLFGGNDVFVTGDTIWGPMHTNGKLGTKGSPVFFGKATSKLGLKMNAPKDPKFYGGYESGIDVPFVVDTTGIPTAAATNGKFFPGGPQDVRLEFNADASVTWSVRPSAGAWSAPVTEPMNTFAPNGVVWNHKGNLYVSGTVNGSYTIGVGISSGVGTGNVHIEDDLVYRTDPIDDPNCSDMLGVISGNNIVIDDTPANHNNVNIHASILCNGGGLMVEDLNTFPSAGTLYFAGGIIGEQNGDYAITNGAGSVTNGYNLKLKYDERFMVVAPPAFPNSGKLEIVSWYE